MNKNTIYLIGYMGSGKTTIGRKLSKELGFQFLDVDLFLENRHRKTIGRIFEESGESVFREMEHRVLEEISAFENVVVSTGGGVPCFHNNMELMNNTGITIYLKVSVAGLAARLETCKQTRPLIRNKSSEELVSFISENLTKRESFYNQASIIFDAEKLLNNMDVDIIVSNLINYLPQVIES